MPHLPRLTTRLSPVLVAAVTLACAVAIPRAAVAGARSAATSPDRNWTLSTTTYAPHGEGGYLPTYLGNGYFSARLPAQGTGFSTAPVSTESQLAGFYGQGPGTTIQRANLPAWSSLGYSDGSGTFGTVTQPGCRAGTVCEAESGTLTGSTKIASDHTGYTGSGFVAGFASGGVPQRGSADTVRITDAHAGTATLAVRYAAATNSSAQTLHVSVDGGTPAAVTMPATASWNTWAKVTVPVSLHDGDNTVALSCGASDTCLVNVDSIDVVSAPCAFGQFCDAETGSRSGSTKVAADHTGYTGTGFVAGFAANGNVPQRGASDTVHVLGAAQGAAVLTVRYAAAVDRSTQTLSAAVDGGSPQQVSLPATADWNTWQTATIPVTLTGGDDTVAVSCGQGDSCVVNVDAVALSTRPLTSDDGTVSDYRQTLDLHSGLVTTSLSWTSPAGHRTDLSFTVFVSRARTHVAAVRVTARPVGWSGPGTFSDLFDGRADVLPASHRTPSPINLTSVSDRAVDPGAHRISERATTVGLGMTAGLASTLRFGGTRTPTTATADVPDQSVGQQGTMQLQDGRTYTVTKYVGVAGGTDTADGSAPFATSGTDPVAAAVSASADAARTGWAGLLHAHENAWRGLWSADVEVPGDDALTLKARASMFYLLASIREGVEWSMSPGGLSSAEYNGHVFWDAETWMYPALLAAHPDLASGMNDYRSTLLDAARATAAKNGVQGAQFPWESAQTGADVGIHPREIHITGDVALAQWDYYRATGDREWLRTKGWPLLQGAARFYASRASSDGHGGWQLEGVEGPDENHPDVDNSAYVNVSAVTTLQIAQQAAALVGAPADDDWKPIATGLAASVPFDPTTNTHPEYDGYNGATVNQADVVMLQYPWNYPMAKDVAQADLDYYTPRTALSGPAMTDAINMIDTAALSTPGCSAYTYFRRSVDPYDVGPFDQYSEHLGATGVVDFTTGIGGFLQELYYGFTGLRWGTDQLTLDPMLPPQLPGLQLTGLQWQGRTFDVTIGPAHTSVVLRSGDPMPVSVAGEHHVVEAGSRLSIPTRRPDAAPTTDVGRCAPVDASSSDPSDPAVAAVDGSDATSWKATAPGATLTVDLGSTTEVRHVSVLSGADTTSAYAVDLSADGTHWTPAGSVAASDQKRTTLDVDGSARWVRYRAGDGVVASVAALTVTTDVPAASG